MSDRRGAKNDTNLSYKYVREEQRQGIPFCPSEQQYRLPGLPQCRAILCIVPGCETTPNPHNVGHTLPSTLLGPRPNRETKLEVILSLLIQQQ